MTISKLNIAIIAGTTRKNNATQNAARLIEKVGKEFSEIALKYVDVVDFFPLPGEGNDPESKNPEWIAINEWTDGYFIVSPEYNHSFPGSLKMLLDNDLGNYTHKAVNLAGVSSGPFGGVRMIENSLSMLRQMGFVTCSSDVFFPFVQDLFATTPKDPEALQKQEERIRIAYKELIWMTKTLKWGRENL